MKISIVMVVYNAAESIARTLNSIIEQTYDELELIVIDGGSTDSTLSIIDKYKNNITLLISERDNGIYDAMNKGVRHATGVYTTFLNAGDVYYSDNCLTEMFRDKTVKQFDVVYGSNYYLKNDKMIYQEPRPLSTFYRGMPFNHQSVLVKTRLLKEYPFRNKIYNIQCEYDFLLNLYLSGYSFHYVDVVVAIYEAGGFSDQNFLERTLERWLILKRAKLKEPFIDEYYLGLITENIKHRSSQSPLTRYLNKFKNMLFAR